MQYKHSHHGHGHGHTHGSRNRRSTRHHHSSSSGRGHTSSGSGSGGHHYSKKNHHHDTNSSCQRRHRSATDVSNVCCQDKEIREILIHKKGCCKRTGSSRSELAQYFAEDLYGSSSRRPSSCCSASEYCYHTDSTSLYGSRSSTLSHNNSVKSGGSVGNGHGNGHNRRRRSSQHYRHASYSSVSLRGLNTSAPDSQFGSLTSLIGKPHDKKNGSSGKIVVSPSKVTIEHSSSKEKELPDYACSPSPIRWSFLADGGSKTPSEVCMTTIGDGGVSGGGGGGRCESTHTSYECLSSSRKNKGNNTSDQHTGGCRNMRNGDQKHKSGRSSRSRQHYHSSPSDSRHHRNRSTSDSHKDRNRHTRSDSSSGNVIESEESTTAVIFHQEGEAFNNCCSGNYLQCNAYLDQDLQITSEDICEYLSNNKGVDGEVLNNTKNYPFQPTSALEFQFKNNFPNQNVNNHNNNNNNNNNTSPELRRSSIKETNLNQQNNFISQLPSTSMLDTNNTETGLTPSNINLSSSSNNINIIFNSYMENTNSNNHEVKFINTSRDNNLNAELQASFSGYDFTNVSSNSLFDKPIGIDEIPSTNALLGGGDSSSSNLNNLTSSRQLLSSSTLESLETTAASNHNLLYYRYSISSARSQDGYDQSINQNIEMSSPRRSSANNTQNSQQQQQQQYHHHHHDNNSLFSSIHNRFQYHDLERHQHQHHNRRNSLQYNNEIKDKNFKISSAFKRVRKRARKCADYLRKK